MIVKLFSSGKHSWFIFLSTLFTTVLLFMQSVQAQEFFTKNRGRAEDTQLQDALWGDLDRAAIQILLDGKVNLSFSSSIGQWTPLHIAAQETSYPEVITDFISAGADPNALDSLGNSSFLLASAFNKNPEVVRILAEISNVHLVDKKGLNALHLALMHKQDLDIIMVLIQYGVNPLAEDSMGRTPLNIAETTQGIKKAVIAYVQGVARMRQVQRNDRCAGIVNQLSQSNGN